MISFIIESYLLYCVSETLRGSDRLTIPVQRVYVLAFKLNTYPPRYYQRIAVNRTLDAIARGQDRLLLVMATGTGKTYTAFQ